MKMILDKLAEFGVTIGGRIIMALIVFIIGTVLIKIQKKIIMRAQSKSKLDSTAKSVIKNIIITFLYVVLVLIIIEILGIPMTSVVAVLASCGLAVGLALQGALSNLAGGLMILIFRPFKVGDYVDASDASGTVTDIGVFYTHIVTPDNFHITVPNGDIMNKNVTNYSAEPTRRVNIEFKLTNDLDPQLVKNVLLKAISGTENVLETPEPTVTVVSADKDTLVFAVRAWTANAQCLAVKSVLIEKCTVALRENGIDDPEAKIVVRSAS